MLDFKALFKEILHFYWAHYIHCKTNIEGADGIGRLFEDVTFLGLPLAYHFDIKIVLSYDPAIPFQGVHIAYILAKKGGSKDGPKNSRPKLS